MANHHVIVKLTGCRSLHTLNIDTGDVPVTIDVVGCKKLLDANFNCGNQSEIAGLGGCGRLAFCHMPNNVFMQIDAPAKTLLKNVKNNRGTLPDAPKINDIHMDFARFKASALNPMPGPDDLETIVQHHRTARERNRACVATVSLLSIPKDSFGSVVKKNMIKMRDLIQTGINNILRDNQFNMVHFNELPHAIRSMNIIATARRLGEEGEKAETSIIHWLKNKNTRTPNILYLADADLDNPATWDLLNGLSVRKSLSRLPTYQKLRKTPADVVVFHGKKYSLPPQSLVIIKGDLEPLCKRVPKLLVSDRIKTIPIKNPNQLAGIPRLTLPMTPEQLNRNLRMLNEAYRLIVPEQAPQIIPRQELYDLANVVLSTINHFSNHPSMAAVAATPIIAHATENDIPTPQRRSSGEDFIDPTVQKSKTVSSNIKQISTPTGQYGTVTSPDHEPESTSAPIRAKDEQNLHRTEKITLPIGQKGTITSSDKPNEIAAARVRAGSKANHDEQPIMYDNTGKKPLVANLTGSDEQEPDIAGQKIKIESVIDRNAQPTPIVMETVGITPSQAILSEDHERDVEASSLKAQTQHKAIRAIAKPIKGTTLNYEQLLNATEELANAMQALTSRAKEISDPGKPYPVALESAAISITEATDELSVVKHITAETGVIKPKSSAAKQLTTAALELTTAIQALYQASITQHADKAIDIDLHHKTNHPVYANTPKPTPVNTGNIERDFLIDTLNAIRDELIEVLDAKKQSSGMFGTSLGLSNMRKELINGLIWHLSSGKPMLEADINRHLKELNKDPNCAAALHDITEPLKQHLMGKAGPSAGKMK